MKFTEKQLQAINHLQGPCLVLAVPGAGKTTVLLERIQRLISTGIDPKSIASLTFSKQQALDMENRYVEKYPSGLGPVFSTIHAFCYSILKNYAEKKSLQLKLIESSEQYNKYSILRSIYRSLYSSFMSDEDVEDFFRIDGYLKNSLSDYNSYKKSMGRSSRHFESLSKAYESFKRDRSLIDFDDMLILTLKLLLKDDNLLNSLRGRFKYFQLDEAQDSSAVQIKILSLLSQPLNNILMVADDDQAIYGFRGADPSYLLQFKNAYPHARIITMEDNYRSAKNIVSLAGSFIVKNNKRYKKKAVSKFSSDEKTKVIICKSLAHQTLRLMEELKEDLPDKSKAILFRNNFSLIGPADALHRASIPFQCSANSKRFFKHKVVCDIKDFFSLINDPSDLDAFSRIYYKMNQYLKKSFLEDLYPYQGLNVWDCLYDLPGVENSFYRKKIEFLSHQFKLMARMTPHDAIWQLYQHIGYGEYLRETSKMKADAVSNHNRIIESMLLITENIKTYAGFDTYFKNFEDYLIEATSQKANLVLSTIHASKGLEYDNVYMIDLIQNEFPSAMALDFSEQGQYGLLEEERRLFYVAMTRARHKLRLFGRKSVNGYECKISQFIDELAGKKINKKGNK